MNFGLWRANQSIQAYSFEITGIADLKQLNGCFIKRKIIEYVFVLKNRQKQKNFDIKIDRKNKRFELFQKKHYLRIIFDIFSLTTKKSNFRPF